MENRKKILFLVTQSEFGGAQRFIYRLITNLDLSKYDISVAAGPEGNDANGLLFNLEKQGFNRFSLKFLKRAINPIIDFLALVEIHNLIKKERPDIIFLCSTKAGILGSLAAVLIPKSYIPNSKVIYRIGGWTFNDPWPKWKKNLYLWLEKKTARFKDIIVNNAKSDAKQAKELGIIPRKQILTIYNGVDAKDLNFLPEEKAREFLKIKSGFLVGTVANFYPAKGLEYLIEAANLLKDRDIGFVIIGDGQERKRLDKLSKKWGLESVFMPGAVPESYRYLKAFGAFVSPSLKEGFPWTIIEAMAAEVPVIATRVGAIPEIIEDGKTGFLVDVRNPQQIAKLIISLSEDKNLSEKITRAAKESVVKNFNTKQMLKKYEDLFFID